MLYLLALFLYFLVYLAIRSEYVVVTIRAQVPSYTPDRVLIIGNLDCLGNWKEFSREMEKVESGLFETKIRVQRSETISFKFSLGSWETVEKGSRFEDVANRSIEAKKNLVLELEVHHFGGYEWESRSHTRTGNFQFLRNFPARSLSNQRNIIIYLPPSYTKETARRYPVLYMHDGNNVFDSQTAFMGVEWEVDEASETLIRHGAIEESIIVGVYNTAHRMDEYTPIRSGKYGGGSGRQYLEFLIKELMPVINQRFRTLKGAQHTGIMGSSLGGLISLYAGFAYPDAFSMVGSLSPSLWWGDHYMEREFIPAQKHHKGMKIWMDMGTREGMNSKGFSIALEDTRRMNRLLQKLGYSQGEDLYYFEHQGAGHDEASWARRIHLPLLYFLGEEVDSSLWKIPLSLSLPQPQEEETNLLRAS